LTVKEKTKKIRGSFFELLSKDSELHSYIFSGEIPWLIHLKLANVLVRLTKNVTTIRGDVP